MEWLKHPQKNSLLHVVQMKMVEDVQDLPIVQLAKTVPAVNIVIAVEVVEFAIAEKAVAIVLLLVSLKATLQEQPTLRNQKGQVDKIFIKETIFLFPTQHLI